MTVAMIRLLTSRAEDAVRELVSDPREQARTLEELAQSLRWRAELVRNRRGNRGACVHCGGSHWVQLRCPAGRRYENER